MKLESSTLGGLILFFIGVMVVTGWLTHQPLIIQVFPTAVPMTFNTALSFIFAGLGFISLTRYKSLSILFGLILSCFIGLILQQTFFQTNIGIDELFLKAYITTKTTFPGRPAPQTSICLLLIGLFLTFQNKLNNYVFSTLAFISAVLISIIGLVALTGFITGMSNPYIWNLWNQMATHAAVGIIIAGITMMSIVQKYQSDEDKLSYYLILILAFVCFFFLCLWQILLKFESSKVNNVLQQVFMQSGNQVTKELTADKLAIDRMQQRLLNHPDMPISFWEQDAEAYLQHIPAINGFALITKPNFVIENFKTNKNISPQAFTQDIHQCLLQGLANVSVLSNNPEKLCLLTKGRLNNHDSYLLTIINLTNYIKTIEETNLAAGYGLELRYQNQTIFSISNNYPDLKNIFGVKIPLNLLNMKFTLVAWPDAKLVKQLETELPFYIFLIGIFFSILLFFVVWSTLKAIRNKNKAIESEQRAINLTQQLEAILNSSCVSIISTDLNGVITHFNRAAEKMLGYTAAEMIGIKTPEVYHDPDEVLTMSKDFSQALDKKITPGFQTFIAELGSKESSEHEWTYISKSGRRIPVILSVTSLRDANNRPTGYLGIALDISERKEVEKVKNEFISVISHELRTPLTSIHGSIILLKELLGTGQTPETLELLSIALNNTERLIRLINEILDIEKISAGKVELSKKALSVNELLREGVSSTQGYADKFSVKLSLTITLADNVRIFVDHDRMIQVLTNIISNAIKFSPPDSSVKISADVINDNVNIGITDQGEGIPQAFQASIFNKFTQADSSAIRKQQGSGLGLNISKSIVEAMGGSISFVTGENVGTTFYITLPLYKEEMAIEKNILVYNAKPNILHVEDDRDLFKMTQSFLKPDYNIYQVESIHGAKELLAKNKYALVILDLNLADGSSLELIPELNKQHIPIVVLTAYDFPEEYKEKVASVLTKSKTSNKTIIETIQDTLEKFT